MLRRRQLQAAVGAAIVAMGLGASSLGAGASVSVTQRTAMAAPAYNLHNGQITWVSSTGFPKSTTVAIVQCNQNVATKGQNACNIGGAVIIQSTQVGRVPPHALKVVVGMVGTGSAKAPCDSTHSCFAVVSTLDQSTAALAPLHFAP
jgi:TRAP-type mannitol/chloroaromatic compound transport system substrate-binding protein